MKKRMIRTAACLVAAVCLFSGPVQALSARRAILMDGITGRVLYEKNADERSLIASTTKIMTALVVCQQCNVLDRVRIPGEAVGVEGSSMYLKEGEVLTVQELLYGLMLQSGNDAAVALAIYCGGTVEGFAELMNDKARALGLDNTHFVNPNGLDAPGHYSTARDLARLASCAMDDPVFRQTVSTKSIRIGERYLTNHNKLLWQVDGAEGVKTGFTKAAGRILVSSASRHGRRLICVTVDDPDDWADHAALYDKGFGAFIRQTILEPGQILGSLTVIGGEGDRVELTATEGFAYPLAEGEKTEILLPGREFAYAPVVRGADAGFAYIRVDGKTVGRVALRYGQTLERKEEEKGGWFASLFGG